MVQVGDLMLIRRFAPNLEVLEGKFVICPAETEAQNQVRRTK